MEVSGRVSGGEWEGCLEVSRMSLWRWVGGCLEVSGRLSGGEWEGCLEMSMMSLWR